MIQKQSQNPLLTLPDCVILVERFARVIQDLKSQVFALVDFQLFFSMIVSLCTRAVYFLPMEVGSHAPCFRSPGCVWCLLLHRVPNCF